MNSVNVAMLEDAATGLGPLLEEVVFVGGATVELWVTDEAAPEFRPTEDVDVIVEIATRNAYYRFEERLREIGFQNHEEDGVICRFMQTQTGLILDVMPTEASILGFENRWQKEAFPAAVPYGFRRGRRSRRCRRNSSSRPSSRRSVRAGKETCTAVATSRTLWFSSTGGRS